MEVERRAQHGCDTGGDFKARQTGRKLEQSGECCIGLFDKMIGMSIGGYVEYGWLFKI